MATKKHKGATLALRIEGEMTIYRAAELKAVLLDAIDAQSTPELDLSGVVEIDTAGVQLLMMSRRAAEAKAKPLKIIARSDKVASTLALLGLQELLEPAK